MDPIVAGAFIDDSTSGHYANARILGVRLRKFSLWHRLLLNTAGSPFMSKGIITMRELRVAVGICRLRPFDSRVRKPWIVPCLIYFAAFWASLWPRKWRRRPKTFHVEQTPIQRALSKRAEAFLAHCADYLQDPEYTVIPPDLGPRRPPPQTPRGRFDDAIEHVAELINWGIPEQRAWEMPLGMARVYRILARRNAGMDVDITTEEDREFRKQMKAASLKVVK